MVFGDFTHSFNGLWTPRVYIYARQIGFQESQGKPRVNIPKFHHPGDSTSRDLFWDGGNVTF